MDGKQWLFLSSVLITTIITSIISLMAWSDTYSIIHPQRELYIAEPNRNFLKVEYILSHPKDYDSFLFGSSKVGSINPKQLQNGHFYNMTYSAGIPHEHLLNLKLFLHSGIRIKHLLIGLEEMSYQESFIKRQHQGITKAHPKATGESWLDYYLFYFFRFPDKLDRSHFVGELTGNKLLFPMDIHNQNGFYDQLIVTQNREIDKASYINDPKFLIPAGFHGNELTTTLQDIKEIVDICHQNHIELKIFINPIHHTTYDATDKALFQKFKSSLAKLTDYYDFSGPNSITTNNLYWLDTTHYNLRVGNYIAYSLYHYGHPPKDFGFYVPKSQ